MSTTPAAPGSVRGVMDETDAVDIDAAQSLSADRDAGRDADRATGGDAGRATERVAGAAVGQDAADQAEDQADTPDLAGADPAGQAADLAPEIGRAHV